MPRRTIAIVLVWITAGCAGRGPAPSTTVTGAPITAQAPAHGSTSYIDSLRAIIGEESPLSLDPRLQAVAESAVRAVGKAAAVVVLEPDTGVVRALFTVIEDIQSWLGVTDVDPNLWIEVEGSPTDPRVSPFRTGKGNDLLAQRRFQPGPAGCEHLRAVPGITIAMAIKASLLEEITSGAVEAPGAAKAPPVVDPPIPLAPPHPRTLGANQRRGSRRDSGLVVRRGAAARALALLDLCGQARSPAFRRWWF